MALIRKSASLGLTLSLKLVWRACKSDLLNGLKFYFFGQEFTLSNSFQTIQDFVNLDEVTSQSLCTTSTPRVFGYNFDVRLG